MVASGRRNIKPGLEYNKYFLSSDLQGKEITLKADGDTFDTILHMKDIVLKSKNQVAQLAATLKGANRQETCRNIWNFVYNHFQYKQDSASAEQLRTPSRSWRDRKEGIDCDCMSILISSILCNLQIPHAFRKTKYYGKDYFQHIYIVVPATGSKISGSDYYTLDAVVDQFDYEVPFSAKHDLNMQINMLNGLGNPNGGISLSGLAGVIDSYPHAKQFCCEFNGLGSLPGVAYSEEVLDAEVLLRIKRHLQNTLMELDLNPSAISAIGLNPTAFRSRLVMLLQNWDNAPVRDHLLEEMEAEEARAGLNGVPGLHGFFSKIKKAVRKTTSKVSVAANKSVRRVTRNIAKTTKHAFKKVGAGVNQASNWTADKAKAAVKLVVKYNPLTIAIRNGMLLAFKINLFKIAERLGYALWTEEVARAKGLNMNEYTKVKSTYAKVLNVFMKLGGDKKNLDKALGTGWDHGTKKHGLLRGLGEPATAATTAAASGVLATIAAWLSKIDFKALFNGKFPAEYGADNQAATTAPGDGNPLPAELAQAILAAGGQVFQPKAPAGKAPVQYTMPAQQDPTGQYLPEGMKETSGSNMGMLALAAVGVGAAILILKK